MRLSLICLLYVLILNSCTATRTIMVPPMERAPTIYDIYQAVLDTFVELSIPVEFQEPPYTLESIWMHWPNSTKSKVLGFPLTWWKYSAIIEKDNVLLKAKGRGFGLMPPFILGNFLAPIDWIAKPLQGNLRTMGIDVRTEIVP